MKFTDRVKEWCGIPVPQPEESNIEASEAEKSSIFCKALGELAVTGTDQPLDAPHSR